MQKLEVIDPVSVYAPVVAQGAALLDMKRNDWREEIDIEILDIGDPIRCILGQMYGVYSKGVEFISDEMKKTITDFKQYPFLENHGFDAEYVVYIHNKFVQPNADHLTGAWKRELAA